MALQGLFLTTWVGWLFGVIVLKRPWGKPSFSSWFSFSSFYSIFHLVMYFVVTVDFYNNGADIVFVGETHPFGKWVKAFAIMQFIILTLLKRFALFANAKKLGKLMETLSKNIEENKDKVPRKNCVSLEIIIIHLTFLITFAAIVANSSSFFIENSQRPSWFKALGPLGFSIFFSVFAIIPLTIVTNCVFAIIMVLSHHVAEIFSRFCYQVETSLPAISLSLGAEKNDLEIYNILHITPTRGFMEKRSIKKGQGCSSVAPRTRVNPEGHLQPPKPQQSVNTPSFLTRQDVIDRLEEIKQLMKLANEALSSLTLFALIGTTLGLVSNASQMMVVSHSGLILVSDVLIFILMALYTVILQTEHQNREKQKHAKVGMYRALLNLPWTPEKILLEDIIQDIMECEWKLSASGFFKVDRRLASGIFSLVLNYVVIFVQLNIALETTPPTQPSCSKNSSNTTT